MKTIRTVLFAAALSGALVMNQSAAFADGATLFSVLSGGNEVTATDPNTGDLNGWGSATIIIRSSTSLCYAILVTGIDTPSAAHIHEARAGAIGGPVQTLTAPSAGNPGRSSGCLTPADPGLISRLRANPSNFYINVHTGDFPAGAVRGQLH
jgi:hypothetical protein